MKSDKLTLFFKMNRSSQVAVKTAHGMTQRVNMSNIIMQGTGWGPLFCTATMDKLPKITYENRELIYKIEVDVPPLETVNEILTI